MADGPDGLAVILDFAEPLRTAAAGVTSKVNEAIAARASRMLQMLSVPATVRVEWRSPSRTEWTSIAVGSEVCSYPDTVFDRARAYVTDSPGPLSTDKMRDWLVNAFRETPETATEVVAHAFEQILELQPEVLVQDGQVASWLDAPGRSTAGTALPRPAVKRLLRAMVALRCSIADARPDRGHLLDTALTEEERIEQTVSEACAGDIEIRLGPDLHASLMQVSGDKQQIDAIREALYQELGLLLGNVRVGLDAELQPKGVRYRINACDTQAFQCLGPGQILVNDTADRLRLLNAEAVDALNVTGQPAAITSIEHRTRLEEAGLTVWDQWGLVALALAQAIRRNAACFVRTDLTGIQMQKLAREYPKLVDAARSRFSDTRVSAVLRALVAEQVSIRDLKSVLDRLVDLRYANDPLCQHLLLDERYARPAVNDWTIPETVEFVRAGLRRQLGAKLARGTETVVVYLLSDKVERLAVADDLDTEARVEADRSIAGAVRAEMAHLPPTALVPVILTERRVRPHLRRILHRTFPTLSFASFDELPTGLNVQPIARIDF